MSIDGGLNENVWGGLLPKRETESAQFCEKHPEWDGRGVIVGIMDTGVCPAAIGLQKTSDGRPKVIDIIDCTGSGDVLMSEWIKPSEEGFLTHDFLGALKMKVNNSWVNPTGQYRVACKVGFAVDVNDCYCCYCSTLCVFRLFATESSLVLPLPLI